MATVRGVDDAPVKLLENLLREALRQHGADATTVERQLAEPSPELLAAVKELVCRHLNAPNSPNRDAVRIVPPARVEDDWCDPLSIQLSRLREITAALPGGVIPDVPFACEDAQQWLASVGPVVLLPTIDWLGDLLRPTTGRYWDVYAKFKRATGWAIDLMRQQLDDRFEDSSQWQSSTYERSITDVNCVAKCVERRRALEQAQTGSVMAVAVDLLNTLGGDRLYSTRRARQEIEQQGRFELSLVDLAWIVALNPRLVQYERRFTCSFETLGGWSRGVYERDGCREATTSGFEGRYCAEILNGVLTLGSDLSSDAQPSEDFTTGNFALALPV